MLNTIRTFFQYRKGPTNKAVTLHSLSLTVKHVFLDPVATKVHWVFIIFIASLFIFVPQLQPIDWDLYTRYFWSNGLATYQTPRIVGPPWGLILMLPYYFMRPAGARVLSVIVIGWLAHRRRWPLVYFLFVVMGPFFLVTLSKSNMDILVFVFPILLWEKAAGTSWQSLGRGLALSFLLLKPQGAILIWPYLLWGERHNWRLLIKPIMLVSLIVIPISLVGSRPLILQWIDNLRNPAPLNIFFWSINNLSLSALLNPVWALLILIAAFVALRALMRWRGRPWSYNHTLASLLMVSMFLSPYTSQQSFSSALAFLPSLGAFLIQVFILFFAIQEVNYLAYISLWAFGMGIVSLFFYRPPAAASSFEDAS